MPKKARAIAVYPPLRTVFLPPSRLFLNACCAAFRQHSDRENSDASNIKKRNNRLRRRRPAYRLCADTAGGSGYFARLRGLNTPSRPSYARGAYARLRPASGQAGAPKARIYQCANGLRAGAMTCKTSPDFARIGIISAFKTRNKQSFAHIIHE